MEPEGDPIYFIEESLGDLSPNGGFGGEKPVGILAPAAPDRSVADFKIDGFV